MSNSSLPARRILFVNRYYWPDESATALMLRGVAESLAAAGWEVEVVTSRQLYGNAAARLPASEARHGVKVRRVWSTWFGRSFLPGRAVDYATFWLSAALVLIAASRRGTVVVTKTDPPLLSLAGWAAAALKGASHIHWSQDVFPEVAWARALASGRQPLAYRALAACRSASLRSAAGVVAIGDEMAAGLRELLGPGVPIEVIPNFADGRAVFPVDPDANALRREWGLDGKFALVYSGNLGRVHEIETALAASWQISLDEGIVFVFVGGGQLRRQLEKRVPAGKEAMFRFLPYQPFERLAESLSAADAHWLSLDPAYSRYVFPSKLYGILAAGRPSIFVGDPQSDVAKLISDRQVGFPVAAGDISAFLAAARQLRADAAMSRAMGERARLLFDAEFDLPRVANSWIQFLNRTQPSLVKLAATS
jgi:colanic acid biosynthesis glycosyl transferase WcaI